MATDTAPAQEDSQPTQDPSAVRRRGLPTWLIALLVVVVSAGGLHFVQRTFRLLAFDTLPEGYRFQIWTSNWTMQTMGLEDMFPAGPRALWYDHVYPPLLDAIRYAIAAPLFTDPAKPPYIDVDFALYAIYAVCFGITNAVVYLWVRDLTRSNWWALSATVVWAIYPGYLTTMMLLEPSPLAVTFLAVMFYFLYRFLRTRRLGYVSGFLVAALLASLTRNITQPHVLLILVVAVVAFSFMARNRTWWLAVINVLLLALLFVMPVKQYMMFATMDSTTHSGYHRVGMLWIDPRTVPEPAAWPDNINENATTFSSRYNTQTTMKDNYRLSNAANDFLLHHPVEAVGRLAKSLTITVPELLKPESGYTQNFIVDTLPWRGVYDWISSGWRIVLLVLASLAVVFASRGRRGSWEMVRRYGWFVVFYGLIAAPVLWSNRYYPDREDEGPIWTEASRLKAFIEVPIYILIVYATWSLVSRVRTRQAPPTITSAAEG